MPQRSNYFGDRGCHYRTEEYEHVFHVRTQANISFEFGTILTVEDSKKDEDAQRTVSNLQQNCILTMACLPPTTHMYRFFEICDSRDTYLANPQYFDWRTPPPQKENPSPGMYVLLGGFKEEPGKRGPSLKDEPIFFQKLGLFFQGVVFFWALHSETTKEGTPSGFQRSTGPCETQRFRRIQTPKKCHENLANTLSDAL